MSNSNNTNAGGIGLLGCTFIVFLVLKLTNYITWSWWWVTSPLWISAVVWLSIFVIILLVYLLTAIFKS